jgi:hypothetical protein
MVHGEWVRQSRLGGARAALVLAGPHDDCAFREGPHWVEQRLRRRQSLLRQGVTWLEVAAGNQPAVRAALDRLLRGQPPPAAPGKGALQGLRRLLVGLLPAFAVAAGVALLADRPAPGRATDEGQLRVVLAHAGKIKAATGAGLSPGEQTRLPAGVSAAQVLGGERHLVRLRLEVDGAPALEREFRPGGLHREGAAGGLETRALPPGQHHVRVHLMDDGAAWRVVFEGPVEAGAGEVRILTYEPERDAFALR